MPDDVMPGGQPAVRVTAMPANANVYGDIFGGWLMAQMDLPRRRPPPSMRAAVR